MLTSRGWGLLTFMVYYRGPLSFPSTLDAELSGSGGKYLVVVEAVLVLWSCAVLSPSCIHLLNSITIPLMDITSPLLQMSKQKPRMVN